MSDLAGVVETSPGLPGVLSTSLVDFEEPEAAEAAEAEGSESSAQDAGSEAAEPVEAAAGEEAAAPAEAEKAEVAEPEVEADVRDAVLAKLAEEAFERKYETREQAVQAIKSAIGRSRRMEAERASAVQAIEAWKGENQRLRAELEALRGGSNPPAPAKGDATETTSTKAEAKSDRQAFIDFVGREGWARYEELIEEKGQAFATAWLQDRRDAYDEARLEARLGERLGELEKRLEGPLTLARQVQEQKQVTEATLSFLDAASLQTNDDGTPRFPWIAEMQSEEDAAAFMREFIKLPPEFAFTADGLELAGVRWLRSRGGAPAAAKPAAATPKAGERGSGSNGSARRVESEGTLSARSMGMGVPTALRRGRATDELETRIDELRKRHELLGF